MPIAVPMRVTSSEIRRRSESEFAKRYRRGDGHWCRQRIVERPVVDLLGLSSPSAADLPHPGRFEISTPGSPGSEMQPPASKRPVLNGEATSAKDSQPDAPRTSGGRPPLPRTSISHGNPPRSLNMYSPERSRDHQRRFSFATPAGRRNSNSIAAQLAGGGGGRHSHEYVADDDELEGDLRLRSGRRHGRYSPEGHRRETRARQEQEPGIYVVLVGRELSAPLWIESSLYHFFSILSVFFLLPTKHLYHLGQTERVRVPAPCYSPAPLATLPCSGAAWFLQRAGTRLGWDTISRPRTAQETRQKHEQTNGPQDDGGEKRHSVSKLCKVMRIDKEAKRSAERPTGGPCALHDKSSL